MDTKTDISISIKLLTDKLNADIAETRKKIKTLVTPEDIQEQVKSLGKLQKNLKQIRDTAQGAKPQFASWALSIMFAGMAMQRAAMSFMTWGTKAFDDVSHSVIGTITANDRLQGSLLYLGYVVGEAFQPILEMLVPIVMSIADWVSNNEELVRTLETAALILGSIMAYGGMFKLLSSGIEGVVASVDALGATNLIGGIFALTTSTPFIVALLAAEAAAVALKTAFDESPAFKKNFTSDILGPLGQAFKNLWETLKTLFEKESALGTLFDYIGGAVLILTRIFFATFIPVLVILIETLNMTLIGFNGLFKSIQGDSKGTTAALDQMKNSADNIRASLKGAGAEWSSILLAGGTGQFSMSAQMAQYNKMHPTLPEVSAPKPQQGFSSMNQGYSSAGVGSPMQVQITNAYITPDTSLGYIIQGHT